MNDVLNPYITRYPGDLVTSEDWNDVQVEIKKDIAAHIQEAIDGIESVPHAEDADKLSGKTVEELLKELLEQTLSQIPKQTGYMKLFKRLKVGEEVVIEHNLKTPPLLDIYQLDYFPVACSEDELKLFTWTTFYLYHSSEKRLRFKDDSDPSGNIVTVNIEPADGHAFRILFKDMLKMYNVEYTESSSLGDLETEFWKAFSKAPNDTFHDDQACHSPWFDRCCREEGTVRSLKRKRDWDDLWFQMRPRRTVNMAADPGGAGADPAAFVAPPPLQIVHYDFNTLGITVQENPDYPEVDGEAVSGIEEDILNAMILLKV